MIQEPTPLTPAPRRSGPGGLGLAMVLVACLAIVVPAVLVLGSAPTSTPSAAGASAEVPSGTGPAVAPDEAADKPLDRLRDKLPGWAKERLGNGHAFGRGQGRGPITITAISGSSVSLATADGWKRTITVDSATKISKGGQAIAIGDLKVGDAIRLGQKRQGDGSFAITSIVVTVPKVGGEVTAVSGDSITIRQRDGSTQVVTVSASTTYTLGKAAASKADVKVGVTIGALGEVDGSKFTALSVHIALAKAGGEVSAVSGTSITVKGRDGTTVVIHVSATTTYWVKGIAKDAAKLTDIAVGDRVAAAGVRRDDGSLDASAVQARGPKARGQQRSDPSPAAPTS